MRGNRFTRAGMLALVLMAVIVPTTIAATIISEDEYVLEAGETVEGDHYVFANKVLIEGTVKGDLIAAGSEVTIGPSGVVEQDLTAGGRDVIIAGEVGDDVRAAGFVVRLDEGGEIKDDMLAAGFSVEALTDSIIGGDLIAAGFQAVLNGSIGGSVLFAGNGLEVQGTIDGDLTAEVGGDEAGTPFMFIPGMPRIEMIDPGLNFGSSANVGGKLKVTSPLEIEVPDGVAESVEVVETAPSVEDEEVVEPEPEPPWIQTWLIRILKDYIALVVIGLLLLWLLPRLMGAAARALDTATLPSAGWGCLVLLVALVGLLVLFIATVLAFIIIGITKIGPLAGPVFSASFVLGTLLTFGLYLLTWVAKVVAGSWIGRFVLRNTEEGTNLARFGPMLVGMIIFAILINIPMIGFIFNWTGVLLGLGALVLVSRAYWPTAAEPVVSDAHME